MERKAEKQKPEECKKEKSMKNKKVKWFVILAAITAAVCAVLFFGFRKDKGLVDETAVARAESDEGDIHYFDEDAVALAGEAQTTVAMNEALATLAIVNAHRSNAGLPELVWNDSLAQAAMVRAQECMQSFSHTRPNGSAWWTVNSVIMYGENLAMNYFNANNVVAAWMASPTHMAKIVGSFTSVGVACYQAPNGAWYWAQEFGY